MTSDTGKHRARELEQSQYEVFVRKARNAAMQSLFFLYDLQGLDLTAYAEDAAFALRQVRALVDGVHIPRRFVTPPGAGAPSSQGVAPRAATEPRRNGLQRALEFFVEVDGEPRDLFMLSQGSSEEVFAFWTRHIWSELHSLGLLDEVSTRRLILQLQAFIRITRPIDAVGYFTMLVRKLGLFAARNYALIFGLLALIAIWRQEVLWSLVLNGGLRSVLPFIAVIIAGAISLAIGSVAPKTVGKRAFFTVAYPAQEPERGIHSWPDNSKLRRSIGRTEIFKIAVLAILLASSGLVFWLVADPTQRTLFVLAALSWCAVIALHWFDVWDFLDPRPIRFLMLLGLSMLGFGVLTDLYRQIVYFSFGLLILVWAYTSWRKRRVTEVGALLAGVCAVTIGSVWWGDRTLERSAWGEQTGSRGSTAPQRVVASAWPFPSRLDDGGPAPVVVMAASGGGSRAAIYTALTLQALSRDLPEVANQLQAISSVSGGSLANAVYVTMRYHRMQAIASHADLSHGQLYKRVSQDFLYPTLLGALLPSSSRGTEIEKYWEEQAGLEAHTLGDLAQTWSAACSEAQADRTTASFPPFPMPLFNSCTLDGHAAVISPLESSGYLDAHDDASRVKELREWYAVNDDVELTWVQDRDVVYPLEALSSHLDPKLSQAVRASANFPFGFPLVDVHTQKPWGPSWIHARKNLVSLTDGGVLSNSGLWTLFHLLTHDSHSEVLKRRGVLLIVVDASKMPVYLPDRRNLSSLYGAIEDQDPIAQSLHRRMFELLYLVYGDAIKIVKIDLIPSVSDNVYTTWALDEKSQKSLVRSFDCVWSNPKAKAHARDTIRDDWEELKRYAAQSQAESLAAGKSFPPQACTAVGPVSQAETRETSISAGRDPGASAVAPAANGPENTPPNTVQPPRSAPRESVAIAKWRASAASMLRPPLD